jgi:hypothetical protein
MNCQTFREIVHEIDLPGGLEVSALDAALGHAQACGRCARLLHQTRELVLSLEALAQADHHRQASPEIEARLIAEFRAQVSRRLWKAWHGWAAPAAWAWPAACAALAVAGGLLWLHLRSTAERVPRRAAASPSGLQLSLGGPSPALTFSPPDRSAPAFVIHARVRGNSATPRKEPEELADFIPLPFADEDAPLNAGEVVRIQLSDSDLGLLGVPVSDDAGTRALSADVVIGEDGVARAIRFLPSSQD